MAARSRPRGQLKEEFDEERALWNSIKADGRRVDQLMVRDIFVVITSIAIAISTFIAIISSPWARYLRIFVILTATWATTDVNMDEKIHMSGASGKKSRKMADAPTGAWYGAKSYLVACFAHFNYIDIRSLANMLQKESDVLQEKIAALVAEQSARQGSLPSWLSHIHPTVLTQPDRGEETSARIDDELEELLRDNIRNLNEAQTLLQPVEGGNDVSTQMTLLAALRQSEEAPPSASRATSVGHGKSGRDRQGKRKLTDNIDDRDSIAADSPGGPSPKVVISSQKDRLVAKSGSSRAGSVPVAREGSVKMDEDDSGKGKMVLPPSKTKPTIKYKTKRWAVLRYRRSF
jgi:hypothetical protein